MAMKRPFPVALLIMYDNIRQIAYHLPIFASVFTKYITRSFQTNSSRRHPSRLLILFAVTCHGMPCAKYIQVSESHAHLSWASAQNSNILTFSGKSGAPLVSADKIPYWRGEIYYSTDPLCITQYCTIKSNLRALNKNVLQTMIHDVRTVLYSFYACLLTKKKIPEKTSKKT